MSNRSLSNTSYMPGHTQQHNGIHATRYRQRTLSRLRRLLVPAVIAATAIVASALAGCSSQKQAGRQPAGEQIPAQASMQTPRQRYDALCAGYGDWQDVSLPVKISLSKPKRINFQAKASMKRNRWIHFSVRLLGFELASVFVDNDSIHAIDKYHKLYLSESLHELLGGAEISIGDIQNLLLGRGFITGTSGGTFTLPMASRLNMQQTPEGLMITPAKQPQNFEYGFILFPDANNLMATSVSVGEKYAGTATYSNFTPTSAAGAFASTVNLSVVKGKNAEAALQWDIMSAKWNNGDNRTWKQPRGYERISAERLLKSITSL